MKHVVITGSTSGIGFAAAVALAREGWRVIGTGREPGRCAAAEAAVRAAAPGAEVEFLAADLGSRREVLSLAERIRRLVHADTEGGLDALVLNAGTVPAWYTVTEDGFETQFAVNHLSGFLLARELDHELRRAGEARIVTTSSGSHRGARIHWKDVMMRRSYNPLSAYKQSKLANVLFTVEYNRRRARGAGPRAYAVDPGLVDTAIGEKGGGIVAFVWRWRRKGGAKPEAAARTIVHLVAEPSLADAEAPYWKDLRPVNPSRRAFDEGEGRSLWELSERLCGESVATGRTQ